MIEKCFFVLVILSIGFGFCTGNMSEVSNAALDGAANAVTVVISLCGAMCLWNGVMEVLKESGAVRALSRLLSPVLFLLLTCTLLLLGTLALYFWVKRSGARRLAAL